MVTFICRRCRTVLSIPDDALRDKTAGELKCAVCQEAMVAEDAPVHQGKDLTLLRMITGHGKKVLVAIEEQALAEKVAQAMSGRDWNVVVSQTPASALSQLAGTQYDFVVLHARGTASSLREDPVLRYLQRLPMTQRRDLWLCLLCDESPTLDRMTAFRAGVNLVVNTQDVEQLQGMLHHVMGEYEIAYAKFNDELRSRGNSPI